MVPDDHWFTEYDEHGIALSLKIEGKLHSEKTPYQQIDIYQTETFGRLMVIDGCVMLSGRDNFLYHEMMSHPALLSHPRPANVVIIGGGDCGTLREVVKHGEVEQVTMVEIDERVTRLSEQYFPELCSANDNPRVKFLFDDGIAYVRNTAAASVDLIIVDSTDPVGPAKGLFSAAFYRDCAQALRDDGLLVQQSESPLLHLDLLSDMHRAMRESGFARTDLLSFPQPVYPSGWWSATLAARSAQPLRPRLEQADPSKLQTRYYNAQIHAAAFAMPSFMRDRLG